MEKPEPRTVGLSCKPEHLGGQTCRGPGSPTLGLLAAVPWISGHKAEWRVQVYSFRQDGQAATGSLPESDQHELAPHKQVFLPGSVVLTLLAQLHSPRKGPGWRQRGPRAPHSLHSVLTTNSRTHPDTHSPASRTSCRTHSGAPGAADRPRRRGGLWVDLGPELGPASAPCPGHAQAQLKPSSADFTPPSLLS